ATIAKSRGVVTIVNDDTTPSLSINDVSTNEGNSGATTATLTVKLSAPSALPITVKWATADDTAITPGDYASANGTITFAPGVTSQTINVSINGDTLNEADENFFVDLSAPNGATITKSRGAMTIVNDDGAPSLSINDASVTEGNSGITTATLTVKLSAPSALPVTVKWTTADG